MQLLLGGVKLPALQLSKFQMPPALQSVPAAVMDANSSTRAAATPAGSSLDLPTSNRTQPGSVQLQGHQQCISSAVNLLLQALQTGTCEDVRQLCQQPQAAVIDVSCLCLLLEAAEYWQPAAVDVLAGLPAAGKQHVAVVSSWCKPEGLLCKLAARHKPATAAAAAAAMQGVQQAASRVASAHAMTPGLSLLSIPAVQRSISSKGTESLLEAALKAHNAAWVRQLCQLPAAKHMSLSAAQRLLLLAVQQHASPFGLSADVFGWMMANSLCCICKLPPVRRLSSSQVLQAVQAAVQLAHPKALSVLLQLLPEARQLEAGSVLVLLQCVAQMPKSVNGLAVGQLIVELCSMPGAQGLEAGEMTLLSISGLLIQLLAL
jgi:hypothetical protein